jgi:hypothetical protein
MGLGSSFLGILVSCELMLPADPLAQVGTRRPYNHHFKCRCCVWATLRWNYAIDKGTADRLHQCTDRLHQCTDRLHRCTDSLGVETLRES